MAFVIIALFLLRIPGLSEYLFCLWQSRRPVEYAWISFVNDELLPNLRRVAKPEHISPQVRMTIEKEIDKLEVETIKYVRFFFYPREYWALMCVGGACFC